MTNRTFKRIGVLGIMAIMALSFVTAPTVVYADSGSCDQPNFSQSGSSMIVQPYVAGQFVVTILNAKDGSGTALTNSNGTGTVVLSRYNYASAGGTAFSTLQMQYSNGLWVSTGTSANLPTRKNETIYVTFQHTALSGDVCSKTVVTDSNPNGIPDVGSPGGNDICCDTDTTCSTFRGDVSKCDQDNGACASGGACSGGDVLDQGESCDPNNVNNVCRGGRASSSLRCIGSTPKCESPCSAVASQGQALADCLTSKYGINLSTLTFDGAGCTADPTLLVHSGEGDFGQGVSSSDCPQGASNCAAYDNNSHVLMCFAVSSCDVAGASQCSITATYANSNVNAKITSTCMPSGTSYNLSMHSFNNAQLGQAIFPDRSFSGTSGNQINVSVPVTNPPQVGSGGSYIMNVTDSSGDSICTQNLPENFFTGGDITDPGGINPPPPESTDFGVQKCPYFSATKRSVDEQAEFDGCKACVESDSHHTWTALGCIDTTVSGIFSSAVRIALGVMGGVVLLRLIYLGYIYQTGDTKKIQEARSGVVATLAGIVVVVFSVVILRVIGVNILNIVPPNFFGTN